ncbi:MAG: hypothetical protein V3W41_11485 [Planctomycetota bacterium]
MNQPSKRTKVKLRGGLLAPERKQMPTLFSLIIAWFTLTTAALVLVPYAIFRQTDSYFTDGNNVLFWSAICAISTAHGAMAFMLGYRKGGQISNFFWGALLMPLGLIVVSMLNNKRPDRDPQPARGWVKSLDRGTFAFGNLWWGIAQLFLMFAVLIRATVYESQVGGGTGNVAAYARFYNATWFGLIFVSFFITLFCATMRKYPFRISQIGWLCTHTGLLILVIGSLTRYWGMYTGFVRVMEGETVSSVDDRDVRELQVGIPALGYQKNFRVETDHDPVNSSEKQTIAFEAKKNGVSHEFEIELDRYYAKAAFFSELSGLPPADKPTAVAELKLQGKGGKPQIIRLHEQRQPGQDIMGLLKIQLLRATSAHHRDSLTWSYPPGSTQRGALVVKKDGDVLLRIPILPGPRGADPSQGARTDTKHVLEGGVFSIFVDRYFSQLSAREPGDFYDAAPGQAIAPGITFRIDGPNGSSENHSARSDGFWFNSDTNKPSDSQLDFVFEYQCRASNPLPASTIAVIVGPGDERHVAISDGRRQARLEPFKEGATYRFSKTSPFAIEAVACFANGTIREGVRETDLDTGFPAVRATVKYGAKKVKKWIPVGLIRSMPFQFDDTIITLKYEPRKRDLGFSISLLDFREFDYANSTKPAKYESNVILHDPAEQIEERILIDMNNPLGYKGYRFFNSRPLTSDRSKKRGIGFSVSRDPGYAILLLGSFITAIGLMTVFFFKPRLRRIESRRSAKKKTANTKSADQSGTPQPA